jgi:hypothetical protein
VVGDRAAHLDSRPDPVAAGAEHLKHHPAVVDQDLIAWPDVAGQAGVGGRRLGAIAGDVGAGDGELVAGGELDRPEAKRPRRILGPCRSASTPTLRPAASEAALTAR